MHIVKQSTAFTDTVGPVLDSTGAEYTGAVIGDISISKNGTEAAMAAAATLTHISNGMYTLVFTTGNTDTLGRVVIRCNKSTYQMPPVRYEVLASAAFDTLVTNGTLASTTSGRTIVTDASGLVDANAVKIGPTGAGTAQTARDIGASVLLSTGTGTGQLDFTSGVVKANVTQYGGSAGTFASGRPEVNTTHIAGTSQALSGGHLQVNVAEINAQSVTASGTITFPAATLASTTNITAGTITTVTTVTNQLTTAQIATGLWTDTTAGDFTVPLSPGKSIFTGVAPGASGGHFIAGTNAATTITTGLTTTFTGNLTGSVGSVTGAVGSVTGLTASNLDTTVSSRMATYTQPTGFLAATFPTTVASTTNITAATVTLSGTQALYAPAKAGDAMTLTSAYDAAKTAGTSTLTQTQVTGGAYSIQSASCVLGDTRIANLDATVSSRGTSTLTQTQVTGGAYSVQSASCVLGDTRVANLDAAVTSRMATYTQPTGFLAATFPLTVASTTNITAGVITTTTNLTNLPTMPADWLTAAGLAADAATEIGTAVGSAIGPRFDDVDAAIELVPAALLNYTNGIETGVTPKQALRAAMALSAGKVTGAGTGTEIFYAPDGSTARMTFAVDSSGNRTVSVNL